MQAHLQLPTPNTTPPPPPQMSTWGPIDDRRPRKPSPQEMDIFERQETRKSRPEVKGKLNKWYDWLINHVPKPIKDGASKAFKTFKDKIMGLYNRVIGSAGNETRSKEPKPFKPIELEQAFGELTGPIGLMENQRWMLIRSLIE